MRNVSRVSGAAGALALLCLAILPAAHAAQAKIVCWKDAAGKVIGCGDKVPPEFQNAGTKELDARGVTRGTTESAEEVNRRRLKEQEAVRAKVEEDRRSIDQRRHDAALIDTYNNEKEIDLKRDRDLQVVDLQIEQIAVSLKNATQRHNDAKTRVETLEKNKQAVSPQLNDELARARSDKERFEKGMQAKNQEKEDLRSRYAEQRRRYIELRNSSAAGGAAPTASASAVASTSPNVRK